MQVEGLDGMYYKFVPRDKKRDNASKLHLKAREVINSVYPLYRVIEEVKLPGSFYRDLFADFFIPALKLFIEVQGEQHFNYNSYYFSGPKSFAKAQERDRCKKQWFDLNKFDVVYLNYNEDENEWRSKLIG